VHDENALVHAVGDVDAITEHITMLDRDSERLADLRRNCLRDAPEHTWAQAGRRLLDVYASVA
jgi:glycosyltransferase involved in cell wall biosynthesis